VLDALQHQYISVTLPMAPIGKETLKHSASFLRFRGFSLCLQHYYILVQDGWQRLLPKLSFLSVVYRMYQVGRDILAGIML
jgi:hypothetical protein